MRRGARGIAKLIQDAFANLIEQGIPAGAIRNQLTPGSQGPLPPGGNTGTGYTPDPDAVTRVQVRKNSTGSTYARRRLNLIEGTGITITIADDSGNEEIDITFTAVSSAGAYVVAEDGTIVLDADGEPVTAGE